MPKFVRKLLLALEMIKFEHSVFALPFALTGALLGFREGGFNVPEWPRILIWIVIAMVSARSAAMAFNRLVDAEIDGRNPRTSMRHLPAKLLSARFTWVFVAGASFLFLLAARQLNWLCFVLAPVALMIVFFYSFTKRFTSLSHLMLGFALGIAPAAAWIAVRGSLDSRILWLTAAVTFWTAGFDVIYACQDFEFDSSEGLFSIPRQLGLRRALMLARLLHVLMISCLVTLSISLHLSALSMIGVAAIAALLIYEHSLVSPTDFSRVNAAFFTMNGWVSVLFFCFGQPIFSISALPMPVPIEDPRLLPVLSKVDAGERLSAEDGVALYSSSDLLAIGYMANLARERLHGDKTYYNVNRHINPTDVCVASCRLCAFGKRSKDPNSYTMSLEQVWETAGVGWTEAVTEFHIVGGLHPELSLDWFCEMLRGLKQRFPEVHLKAFTMVEIGYLAKRAKLSLRETLVRLRDAGMDSMPGGGAEVFSERVRRIICDHKLTGDEWLETARAAHELGLHSNCTMLYGHIENAEDRVDHLVRLRELQDETKGFVTFIPLAFHPENTALHHLGKTTGFDDLKNIAVSRLMLDNIPHIKAYWIMMTPQIAQIALRFGADDIDGTVVEEKIYHDAGATTGQKMRRQELMQLIRKAGREPVERDTLYRPVERVENAFTVLV